MTQGMCTLHCPKDKLTSYTGHRCASHAKQTNTSAGSSTPGGGKPVDPPKGTGQSRGQTCR